MPASGFWAQALSASDGSHHMCWLSSQPQAHPQDPVTSIQTDVRDASNSARHAIQTSAWKRADLEAGCTISTSCLSLMAVQVLNALLLGVHFKELHLNSHQHVVPWQPLICTWQTDSSNMKFTDRPGCQPYSLACLVTASFLKSRDIWLWGGGLHTGDGQGTTWMLASGCSGTAHGLVSNDGFTACAL